METGSVEDELTRKIEAAVTKGRKNCAWRSQYMKERVMLMDAREEGQSEIIELFKWLFANDRSDDVRKATENSEYMDKLLEEYKRNMSESSTEGNCSEVEKNAMVSAG